MIAFSFSRLTFLGLILALLLALAMAFLGGWAVGVSYAPAQANGTAATAQPAQSAQPAERDVASGMIAPPPQAPSAAPQPNPTPSGAATGGAPAPAASAGSPAPAGASGGQPAPSATGARPPAAPPPANPDQPKAAAPAPPPSPLAQAMTGPLQRFGVTPADEKADPKQERQPGQPVSLLPDPRTAPRELNAELGRLDSAARPVYSLHVATFATDEQADRLYGRLEARHYDVYRVKAEPPAVPQTTIAVRIGAFDQRGLAEAAAQEVKRREGLDARIVRVDPATVSELLKPVKRDKP